MREVVPQGQRLQVLQQAAAAGRGRSRWPMSTSICVCDRRTASADSSMSRPAPANSASSVIAPESATRRKEGHERRGERLVTEHAVDDQLQRPRRQRDEADLDQRQSQDGGHPRAVGPEERRCPANQGHGVSVYAATLPPL